jgi:hypothetical protein
MLQFMTTEHFTLQTARATTVAETNGRCSLYLTTLSGVVVALSFIGQVSEMGEALFVFGFVLLPSSLFLGWSTFVRVLQSGIEDLIYARGINRIRHYYTEVAPSLAEYFILSPYDDVASASLRHLGLIPPGWQLFMTAAGMVGGINSIVSGVLVGLVASRLGGWPLVACAVAGVTIFLLSVLAHHWYQARYWSRVERYLVTRFPMPGT